MVVSQYNPQPVKVQQRSPLSQVEMRAIDQNRISLSIRQNKFNAGTLHKAESTFVSAKRGWKNVFKAFGSPALGLNEEILTAFEFQYIVIPFDGRKLKTTRKKWLEKGIRSPYSAKRNLDQQILLFIDDIRLDEPDQPVKPIPEQGNLFGKEMN